ncbi:unnamed protein product [Meganyctiphanes norvegica]|uniref:BZIP domain-containing protein n=1 Tax=Meganyctiphanes norvegica TaxID=48144 RepID=A0AAV2QG80_MEGNR
MKTILESTLMSEEDLMSMQAVLNDPSADIESFRQYVNTSDDWEDSITTSQQSQDMEELLNSTIETDQTPPRFVEVDDSTVGTQFQLAVQEAVAQDYIQEQNVYVPTMIMNAQELNTDISTLILNTENQLGAEQVGVETLSPPSPYMIQDFSTINFENFVEDKFQIPQYIDLKPATSPSVMINESKPFENTDVLQPTEITNQIPAVHPVCIQVTGQNAMEINTPTAGPSRPRVGRTPRDETPLYNQPEPVCPVERRKWRRAKTAYEHRTSKKTTLIDNAKMIENLTKEMNQLKSQLQIVTAERDTYKLTLNNFMNRTSGNGATPKLPMNIV